MSGNKRKLFLSASLSSFWDKRVINISLRWDKKILIALVTVCLSPCWNQALADMKSLGL